MYDFLINDLQFSPPIDNYPASIRLTTLQPKKTKAVDHGRIYTMTERLVALISFRVLEHRYTNYQAAFGWRCDPLIQNTDEETRAISDKYCQCN